MKSIALIGMMGCGKTTVGETIVNLYPKFTLLDCDLEIEKEENLKITEIFYKYGENYFRNLESKYLKSLKYVDNIILSTGGGIVENRDNLDFLLLNFVVFYLKCDLNILKARLISDLSRPLAKDFDSRFLIREDLYSKAHFTIDVSNKNRYDIVNEILYYYKKID